MSKETCVHPYVIPAAVEVRGERIERLSEDLFACPSWDGERMHRVEYGAGNESYDCSNHGYRGTNCVHILAVGIAHAKQCANTARALAAVADEDEEAYDAIAVERSLSEKHS